MRRCRPGAALTACQAPFWHQEQHQQEQTDSSPATVCVERCTRLVFPNTVGAEELEECRPADERATKRALCLGRDDENDLLYCVETLFICAAAANVVVAAHFPAGRSILLTREQLLPVTKHLFLSSPGAVERAAVEWRKGKNELVKKKTSREGRARRHDRPKRKKRDQNGR